MTHKHPLWVREIAAKAYNAEAYPITLGTLEQIESYPWGRALCNIIAKHVPPPPETAKLDLTKPLICDGERVRLLCDDAPGMKPLVGVMPNGMVRKWDREGRSFDHMHLTNAPEPAQSEGEWVRAEARRIVAEKLERDRKPFSVRDTLLRYRDQWNELQSTRKGIEAGIAHERARKGEG